MTIRKIAELLEAKVILGADKLDLELYGYLYSAVCCAIAGAVCGAMMALML